ncbi:MAG: hypothetical protein ACK5Q5_06440 [Planctomycetaceae bacterium]
MMKRLRNGIQSWTWGVVLALVSQVGTAWAAPVVKRVSPVGLNPGQTTRVTLTGTGLSEMTGLRTSVASESVLAEGIDKNGNLIDRVLFDVTLPADATPGLQALRVVGAGGVSGQRLFLVDDLPTVALAEDNKARTSPQPLPFPAAADGVLGNLEQRYFRFEAAAGQRVVIEVVARRFGSALDPLIVLYNDAGHEVASADDTVGLGGDCQLVHRCDAAGGYVVELRDIRYRGGDDFPFRLRIGDFPCVQTAYPVAVQRGVGTTVEFAGIDVSDVTPQAITVPTDWPHDWLSVSTRRGGGVASGFATLLVTDQPEFLEREPNDAKETANAVGVESNINGRMQSSGDVDLYKLTVAKGARYVFTGMTRLEGAPTDLQLRLLDLEGKQIKTVDDDGVKEGRLDHGFSEAGDYLLEVTDLLKRGGTEYAYRVDIEPYRASFELSVEADALNVPAGGTAIIPVQATRRGHNGEIALSIAGLPEGMTSPTATIGTGQTKAFLSLTLPSDGGQISPTEITIVGTAQVGKETERVVAKAVDWLRGQWNNLAVVPAPARSDIVATAAKAERLNLLVEPNPLVFGRDLKAKVTIKAQRGEGLDADITLATNPNKDAIPKEIALAVKPIPKGKDSIELEFTATGKAPLGSFSLVLTGTLKQDKTTVTATTPVINYQLSPPMTLAVEPASGPLKLGGTLPIQVQLTRNPAFTGDVKITAEGLPKGVTLAETTIAADATQAELTLTAAGDAAAGKLGAAKLKATSAKQAALVVEVPLNEVVIE